MLPKEFPKWCTCHYYFSIWSEKKNEDSISVLVDGGYSGEPFANGVEKLLHCKVNGVKLK